VSLAAGLHRLPDVTDDWNRSSPADSAVTIFEDQRSYLIGVAYRMLGSYGEAEDAVQEAYLRFAATGPSGLRDPRAWLTTVTARICLDALGSARARRESYVGAWLPEPIVADVGWPATASVGLGPEDRVTLDESVSTAMLVVLETLSPAERTAFVLHDVLGLGYPEIADVVGRSEDACRQLVVRARAHVRGRAPRFTPDPQQHTRSVRAFLDACSHGSLEELLEVLDPQVVLRSDGGGQVAGVARRPVIGADDVGRLLLGIARRRAVLARVDTVNGASGLVLTDADQVVGVMSFTVAAGRITEIDFVLAPDKLARVPQS
jgi:RNA polymerase sigma-70 factor (ECF subfamily)